MRRLLPALALLQVACVTGSSADEDILADAVVDATIDVAPDAVPDAMADAATDAVADAAPDAVTDAVQDAVADAVQDAVADAVPDAVADAVPDALPDAVADADVPGSCSIAADCPPGAACQEPICDIDGMCGLIPSPAGTACDDGDPCTVDETCTGSTCGDGVPNSCDDGNDCTVDSCTGACQNVPAAIGTNCVSPGGIPGTCDGGVTCVPSPAGAPNRIFVTQGTWTADLGGIDGANAKCTVEGENQWGAGSGPYIALLSGQDPSESVKARLDASNATGWVRPDGLPVAQNRDDLWSGNHWYPPRLYANGGEVQDPHSFWSATSEDGDAELGGIYTTCGNWGFDASGFTLIGEADAAAEGFRGFLTTSCSAQKRLMCAGISKTATVVHDPVPGRLAFIADGFTGSAGLDAADQLCQAAAGGGNFKALIAQPGVTAISRFDTSGLTWVRPDGVPIVAQASDLLAPGPLLAPIAYQFDGSPVVVKVFTGASEPFNPGIPETTCGNWLDPSGAGTNTDPWSSRSTWFSANDPVSTCNITAYSVFCLED